ncbi:hypothetical protein BIV57_14705 [Mangrovactinospora gilvigrisea]|uniref:DhaL domain-containing protein n=1 Tax=Mangrovactinospora gilvigrisea TaxID=1428644 RepID=A0A1J7BTF5_9ACTN|nr:hypothetical protein BIV57_14705 [Mangrovactinospora gilvigrisea]
MPSLTADMVRQWAAAGLRALERHRAEINGLNVYPVPDADTGTNLHLTFGAAVAELDACLDERPGAGPGDAVRALARGAQLGARGNSGAIIAQLLRGAAEVLAPADDDAGFDAARLGRALRRAADRGYEAVAAPVEGTVLSVVSAAADAAEEALRGAPAGSASGRGRTITTVLAAIEGAERALLRTPEQLDVLGRAGVVDAGGRGLTVLLGALAETVVGRAFDARAFEARAALASTTAVPAAGCETPRPAPDAPSPGYEVVYLLDAADAAVAALRVRLAALGDSLVVVGGDGLWTVHLHTDEPGAAVEAGVETGRPHRIRIEHFGATAAAAGEAGTVPAHADGHRPREGRTVLALADGPGLADVLSGAGATVLTGEADARRATRTVLDSGAAEAVLLPGGPGRWEAFLAAAAELEEAGVHARVVPSESPVQSLAALAVHEPARALDEDAAAMSEAAAATGCAALLPAGDGTVRGVLGPDTAAEPVVTAPDAETAGCLLLDRLLSDGGELLTLLPGADAPLGLAAALRRHAEELRPDTETVILPGGHPATLLTIGLE